jgi:hypothetical protein
MARRGIHLCLGDGVLQWASKRRSTKHKQLRTEVDRIRII